MKRWICSRPNVTTTLLALFLCGSSVSAEDHAYTLRASTGPPPGMEDAVLADNPAHGLTAWIGSRAIRVQPEESPDTWTASFELQRIGRGARLETVGTAGVETLDARAEIHRGTLVEWYENRPQGLEQGFDLATRPAGESGRVVLELAVDAQGLLAKPGENSSSIAFLAPGSRLPALRYGALTVVDADGRPLPASMELVSEDGASLLRLSYDDDGARYPVRVDPLLTTSTWSSTESDVTSSLAWGDWDGDGDLDLAVGNANQPNRVYENTGSALGTAAVWSSSESDNTADVAWGDWDGDGDLDLAVGNVGDPNRVYENTGATLATSATWSASASEPTTSVAWGDWDGDGDLDLAVGNYSQPNRVYENTGGTLSTSPVWSSTESDATWSVAWGDWNGDGDLDLATANDGDPNRVYENTGATLATSAVWSSSESDNSRAIAWGDWNGDGDFDLAAGNYGQPDRVYENTGATLSAGAVWSSSESDLTNDVAWGDWDGDGDLDLASGNSGAPCRVHENTGATLDATAIWSSADSDPTTSVAWGDWDGDGDLDLAAGIASGPNRVYENAGTALVTNAVWSSSVSDDTFGVAWGDWDGDGDLDLATGDVAGLVRVYENDAGILTTNAVWSVDTPGSTWDLAWGDWDGDGDLDLAVGNAGYNFVFENSGGSLGASAAWTSFEYKVTYSVAWGDWDGDGDLDLAAGEGSGPNRVYENLGGTLSTHSVWTSADSDSSLSVAWGDWDGDGDLDLAAGNFGSNVVYENTGGTLSTDAVWTSSETDNTESVAWGDWDGDGDLDLAAGNFDQPNRVYVNTGTGLSAVASWSSMEADVTYSVAWGDWDGDGDLDLAVGNHVVANRVYENTGGTLTTSAVWSSAEADHTYSVAWGDLDGDGDLDLAAGSVRAPDRVYRNSSIARPAKLPETAVGPVIERRPGGTDAARAYSSQCLDSPYPVLDYSLVDEEGDPARRVRFDYTVDGDLWLPATAVGGDLQELSAGPTGMPHQVLWDNLADGVSRALLVRLRITVPSQASTRLAGPIQRAALRAVSPPFSLCIPAADLAVSLDDGATSATPGGTVTYTLTVANDGPDDAVGVTVSDSFPAALSGLAWTCVTGGGGGTCGSASGSGDLDESVDLPSASSVVFTIDADIDAAATGTLENMASAALPPGLQQLTPENDSATDLDILVLSTDLSITNDDGQSSAVPGTPATYTVTVANTGPSDAVGAQVVDVLPSVLGSVTWSCVGSGGGTCTASGSGDLDESVDLPVGATATFTLSGTLDPAATGTLVSSATVFATIPSAINQALPRGPSIGGDPDPSNNNAVDVDPLTPQADLAITKDDGTGVAILGHTLTYTIRVSNPGPSSVAAAAVADLLPPDLVDITWTCLGTGGGSCSPGGSGDLADSADLPAGGLVTYTVTTRVDESSIVTEISNTATVTVPGGVTELDASDNSSTDTDAALEPLFADGFESGDTTGWSSTLE